MKNEESIMHEVDVLIIGGGIGGCIAAIKTKEAGASDVVQYKNALRPLAVLFLTNSQLHDIQLSYLSSSQSAALFEFIDEVAVKERLALFEDQDIAGAIHNGLTGDVLKHLSNEHINKLQLKLLRRGQISKIFTPKRAVEVNKRLFAHFDPVEVQAALVSEKLHGKYILSLLSDKHFKGVTLSKLSRETVNDLFPLGLYNTNNNKKRFAHIDPAEVQAALVSRILHTSNQLELLSNEQIKGLDFSGIPRSTIVTFKRVQELRFGPELSPAQKYDIRIKLMNRGTTWTNSRHSTYNNRAYNTYSQQSPYEDQAFRDARTREYFNQAFGDNPSTDGFPFRNTRYSNHSSGGTTSHSNNDKYYKVLGISSSASTKDIKEAYKKLALKYHPDKRSRLSKYEQEKGEEKFKEISEAYTVLTKEKKKTAPS